MIRAACFVLNHAALEKKCKGQLIIEVAKFTTSKREHLNNILQIQHIVPHQLLPQDQEMK